MKKRGSLTILGLCLLLACIGSAWGQEMQTPPPGLTALHPPVAMPAFRLPDVDGAWVASTTLTGKVLIIRFWATW